MSFFSFVVTRVKLFVAIGLMFISVFGISACSGSGGSNTDDDIKKIETVLSEITDTNVGLNQIADSVSENGGEVGITAFAEEDGQTITYSLVDDNQPTFGAFEIDSETGVVTVADFQLINAFLAPEISVTVQVTSTSSQTNTATFSVKITNVELTNIVDVNELPNVIDDINSENGLSVGIRANAIHDGNSITYSLSDNAGGRFAIDEITGVISVSDHTLINKEENAQHNIEVLATSSSGAVVSESFTIEVKYLYLTSVIDHNEIENHIKEVDLANGLNVGITARAYHDDNTISYSLTRGSEYGFTVNSDTGEVSINDKDLLLNNIQTYYILEITATSTSSDTSASQFSLRLTPVPFMSFDFEDNKVENGFGNWSYSDIGDNECDVYAGINQSKLCNDDGSKFFPYYNPHNNSHIGWTRYGFFDSESSFKIENQSLKVTLTGGAYGGIDGIPQFSGLPIKSKSQYEASIDDPALFAIDPLPGDAYFYFKTKDSYTPISNLKNKNRLTLWVLMPPKYVEFDDYNMAKLSRPNTTFSFYPFIDSSVGGHYYHHASNIAMGGWTKIQFDAHPTHHNAGANNPFSSFSEGGDHYPEQGADYFENMVTFALRASFTRDQLSPFEFFIDEVTTFFSPYENEETINNLAVGYSPYSKRFDVSFEDKYRCIECDAEYELRYSFSPIDNGNYEQAHLPAYVVNFNREHNNELGRVIKSNAGYNQNWAAFDLQVEHQAMLTEGKTIFIAVKDKSVRSDIEQQPADFELVDVPGVGEIRKMDLIKTIDYQIFTPTFPLEFITTELNQGIVGLPFKQQIEVFGSQPPYTFSSTDLPAGLSLSEDGLLSGLPITPGVYNIELQVQSENDSTISKQVVLEVNVMTDFDTLQCGVVVDFGNSLENSLIIDDRFSSVITDVYTDFLEKGTGITIGERGVYNYQGVLVKEPFDLIAGDTIRLVWYNNSESEIIFTPKVSLNDVDRVSDDSLWHNASEVKIKPYQYGISEYTLDDNMTAEVINVNNNFDNNSTLIMDRIELIQNEKSILDICPYPFILE